MCNDTSHTHYIVHSFTVPSFCSRKQIRNPILKPYSGLTARIDYHASENSRLMQVIFCDYSKSDDYTDNSIKFKKQFYALIPKTRMFFFFYLQSLAVHTVYCSFISWNEQGKWKNKRDWRSTRPLFGAFNHDQSYSNRRTFRPKTF